MTDLTTAIRLNVRLFAAAGAAAGSETAVLELYPGATVGDALEKLCGHSEELALVLQKCSYLCDGIAVRDRSTVLQAHQTLDVLPPFAGG
jgi:molybdopterin converting factor small subunit